MEKYSWLCSLGQTEVIASEKAACGSEYHAAPRKESCPIAKSDCGINVTIHYSPSRQGVARAIALPDY
jgi:hypothetical protein